MSFTKTRAYSVLYMFILSVVFAGLLSGIKVATADKVADNEKIAAVKNIVKVFELMPDETIDKASGSELEAVLKGRIKKVAVGADRAVRPLDLNEDSPDFSVWILLDESKAPQAFAFPVGGRGFWGPIAGMLSVDAADGRTIRTVVWTQHGETPGLGARIEEKQYREKFRGKAASPPSEARLAVVPEGSMGSDPHKIDQITGATQTTVVGMGQFLNDNFTRWHEMLPLVKTYLDGAVQAPKITLMSQYRKMKQTDGQE